MKHQIKWRFWAGICFVVLLTGMLLALGALASEELGYTPLSELIPEGAKTVIFRDEMVNAAMQEEYGQLQNADGSYSLVDLEEIEDFYILNHRSVDLSELQLLPNLKELTIHGTPEVMGIMALSQCLKLEYLSFDDISQMNMGELVQAAPEIMIASFDHCGELDYAALAGWKKVVNISLKGSAITDLSYLAQMPELTRLTFSDVPNADFASCRNVSTLKALAVHESVTLQDPSLWQLIANNPGLKRLALEIVWTSETRDFDGTMFPDLDQLAALEIHGATIQNLDFLRKCPNLTLLVLESGKVPSQGLEVLESLKKLENLVMEYVGLTDVSFARGMSLSALWLKNNCITDISPLMGAEQIQTLSLLGNPVKDWTPLTQINGLEKLFYNGSEELPVSAGVETGDRYGWWDSEIDRWAYESRQE